MKYAVNLDIIQRAAERIAPWVNRTPVLTCSTLDHLADRRLFFKCENFQKVGAFKFRGACNAVMSLSDGEARRGVVTHSSGNHAQALALAARLRGIDCHIVMPSTSKAVKKRAVEGYGGRVHLCEPTLQARESTAARVVAETGATFIHPYDDPRVIAGQGTAALELLEQAPGLDGVVVPVGGGGLTSGVTLAARGLDDRIRVFAAEPAGADDAARSKAAGAFVPQTGPDTLCDGLLTSLGELTWPVVRDLVEDVITVPDGPVVAAMRLVWERMKILIEPSSAVTLAVILDERFISLEGLANVGVVFSGGNVDLDDLPWNRNE
ncbi:MAG: pyridoxal-phosphate dependent enzyme [Deltaproteobacteria bacterium]|nr:pyridoxal-phosphate dependent enzyme [Deltaproteobacteria bacterium]